MHKSFSKPFLDLLIQLKYPYVLAKNIIIAHEPVEECIVLTPVKFEPAKRLPEEYGDYYKIDENLIAMAANASKSKVVLVDLGEISLYEIVRNYVNSPYEKNSSLRQ